MKVNGIEVYDITQLEEIWPHATKSTLKLCADLTEQGYVFVANNNNNFGYSAKWEFYQPIRVAHTTRESRPRVLWAIKPEKCEDKKEMEVYYNHSAWR